MKAHVISQTYQLKAHVISQTYQLKAHVISQTYQLKAHVISQTYHMSAFIEFEEYAYSCILYVNIDQILSNKLIWTNALQNRCYMCIQWSRVLYSVVIT